MSKNKANKPFLFIPKNNKCFVSTQMNVEMLARAICKAEGKNPDKLYKKKLLWEYSAEFAKLVISELEKVKITFNTEYKGITSSLRIRVPETPKLNVEYEEKLKIGVQKYIEVFNEGTPRNLGEYVSVKEMHPAVLFLHMNSLKAAINGMLKN